MARPATAKTKILQGVPEYLERSRHEPDAHPLTIEAIAGWIGVSRTNFYKADPEIRALVRQIEAARARPLGAPPPDTDGPPEPLSFGLASAVGRPTLDDLRALEERASPAGMPDDEIDRRIGQRVAEAEWIMRKFLGHVRRGDPVADAPLVLFDLDEAIAGLYRNANALRPLVEERQRRTRLVDSES